MRRLSVAPHDDDDDVVVVVVHVYCVRLAKPNKCMHKDKKNVGIYTVSTRLSEK